MKHLGFITIFTLVLLGGSCSQNPPTMHSVSNNHVSEHPAHTMKLISPNANKFQPNKPETLAFSIIDKHGNVVDSFTTVHEKLMHLIIIRKDLKEFQHLHPEYNPETKTFTLSNLNFSSSGPYRLFADFAPGNNQDKHGNILSTVAYQDITVGENTNFQSSPIGDELRKKTFGDYQVTLLTSPEPLSTNNSSVITFEIKQNGKPVTNLEKYLGALGHTVILHEDDLHYIHTHPIHSETQQPGGKVSFETNFPETGKYKLFSQFQHNGKILTTDFVISVAEGKPPSSSGLEGHDMMHN